MKIVEFQETPNPNALKCVIEGAIPQAGAAGGAGGGLRSYSSPEQAEHDPFARELMAIPGVRSVLIEAGWATLVKMPEARWDGIRARAKKVVEGMDGAR